MVKARSIATFLLTNLGSRPAAAQRRTVTKQTAQIYADCHYIERGSLTREGLPNFVKSVMTQDLTLWLRRSVDLTALAATLSLVLLVDTFRLKRLGG